VVKSGGRSRGGILHAVSRVYDVSGVVQIYIWRDLVLSWGNILPTASLGLVVQQEIELQLINIQSGGPSHLRAGNYGARHKV
jgi:hypothetical protein